MSEIIHCIGCGESIPNELQAIISHCKKYHSHDKPYEYPINYMDMLNAFVGSMFGDKK